MTSETREQDGSGERKSLERRAFLRRFGTAAAVTPAAMVLLSSRQGMSFSNGGNNRKKTGGQPFS